jgi:hypothetical protein
MTHHIIEHPDGRRFSVEPEVFRRVYEPAGFVMLDEEQDVDFLADVPPPKVVRRKPARKRVAK